MFQNDVSHVSISLYTYITVIMNAIDAHAHDLGC
jgi:hypothetical protein